MPTPTSIRSRPPSGSTRWRPSSATTAPTVRGMLLEEVFADARGCVACIPLEI